MAIEIRDARASDAAVVARMCRALARITGVAGGAPMTPERITADLIDARDLAVIVAEDEGRVVGYALYGSAYETAWSARGLYLSDLYVTPGARRRGIARLLMAELARRAGAAGGAFVWWIVTPGNRAAEAFYAALGARREPVAAMAVHGDAFAALAARR